MLSWLRRYLTTWRPPGEYPTTASRPHRGPRRVVVTRYRRQRDPEPLTDAELDAILARLP